MEEHSFIYAGGRRAIAATGLGPIAQAGADARASGVGDTSKVLTKGGIK